jgi:hypothetical protein
MRDKEPVLTSLKVQAMIDLISFETEMFTIVLRFGRKKSDTRRFPVIFKNTNKLSKCYDELEKFKGKTLDEVRTLTEPIYDKYKKYHYRAINQTK